MRFSRSRRKSGLEAILSGLGRALVWGILILVALKLDAPKRLLELYQSLSGVAGRSGGQDAMKRGDTPVTATSSADAGRSRRTAKDTPGDSAVAATGKPGSSGAATGAGDASVAADTGESTAVESGAVGALVDRDVRHAESALGRIGDEEDAVEDVDVDAEARDAAAYRAPDAGTSTRDGTGTLAEVSGDDVLTDASTESGDVGAAAAGSDAAEAERHDRPGSAAEGGDSDEPVPGVVTEDEDAVPGDGTTQCPEDFPIKGNGRSRLYHMPEGFAYARTKPEVCFRTPEAAERAGFRRAKG